MNFNDTCNWMAWKLGIDNNPVIETSEIDSFTITCEGHPVNDEVKE